MMENMLDAENVAPNAVGARVAPPPRARIALTPRARARSALQGAKKASKAKGDKTIEEIYQKKTQLEHILLRPDTYGARTVLPVARRGRHASLAEPARARSRRRARARAVGTIEQVTQPMWVLDADRGKIVNKTISFVRAAPRSRPAPPRARA